MPIRDLKWRPLLHVYLGDPTRPMGAGAEEENIWHYIYIHYKKWYPSPVAMTILGIHTPDELDLKKKIYCIKIQNSEGWSSICIRTSVIGGGRWG